MSTPDQSERIKEELVQIRSALVRIGAHGPPTALYISSETTKELVKAYEELQAAKKSLGGFYGPTFGSSVPSGIDAISLRCAASEQAINESTPAHPSPTDPIDPDRWVSRLTYDRVHARLAEAEEQRDQAQNASDALAEHHTRVFKILNPTGAPHSKTITELAGDVMKRLNKAEESLKHAGYRDEGGAAWKPPLGPKPPALSELVNIMVEADDKQTGYQRCEYMLKPVLQKLGVVTL